MLFFAFILESENPSNSQEAFCLECPTNPVLEYTFALKILDKFRIKFVFFPISQEYKLILSKVLSGKSFAK